jgi:hypothetical protein
MDQLVVEELLKALLRLWEPRMSWKKLRLLLLLVRG